MIGSLGSDQGKSQLLNKFSVAQLKNPLTAEAYFTILNGMRSDTDKEAILYHALDQDAQSLLTL